MYTSQIPDNRLSHDGRESPRKICLRLPSDMAQFLNEQCTALGLEPGAYLQRLIDAEIKPLGLAGHWEKKRIFRMLEPKEELPAQKGNP